MPDKSIHGAAVDAVQEEFDERGLGPADLLVSVILDAVAGHPFFEGQGAILKSNVRVALTGERQ